MEADRRPSAGRPARFRKPTANQEKTMILQECKAPIAELKATVDEIWGRL